MIRTNPAPGPALSGLSLRLRTHSAYRHRTDCISAHLVDLATSKLIAFLKRIEATADHLEAVGRLFSRLAAPILLFSYTVTGAL